MKKVLLLTTAALLASSAMAAGVTRAKSVERTPAPVENCLYTPLAVETFDQMAAPGSHAKKVATKASPDDGTPKAFYKRPAGGLYGVTTTQEGNGFKYSSFYAPYVHAWPFMTATYEQNTLNIGENPTYTWEYFLYNRTSKVSEPLTADGPVLTVAYNSEIDSVPNLEALGSEGYASYNIGAWKTSGSGTSKVKTDHSRSFVMAKSNYETAYSNTADRKMWFSPKFRAANTNRDASNLAGGTYSSGAKDSEGGTTGKWFGRNASGIDALAIAIEKPEHPYLLRQVGVAFQNLAFTTGAAPCEFTVTIYKLDKMNPYDESASVVAEPGEVIAVGHYTMDPAVFEASGTTSGMLQFPLQLDDDGSGLTFEVEPEIDFPILVAFTGYNSPSIADFTLTQSTDLYDEGFGELCYMGRTQSDGSIKYQGLNNFFTSGERKTAVSIYVDVNHPYMVWNKLAETGEYNYPAAGEEHSVEVYTYSPAEEFEITLEDGSDLPDWLTVEAVDEIEDGEWTGITNMVATAAALPAGVAYREANVKLHIPGNSLIFKASQGEKPDGVPGDVNGDGKVDVEDINIAIDIILENTTADSYPAADINGDGKVDVEDINAIIDIILAN